MYVRSIINHAVMMFRVPLYVSFAFRSFRQQYQNENAINLAVVPKKISQGTLLSFNVNFSIAFLK